MMSLCANKSQIQDGAPLRTSERLCGVAHCPMCSDWLRPKIFINCGLFFWRCTSSLLFSSLSVSTYLALYQYRKRIIRCSFNFNFDGLRLSGIERSNYTESNNLGLKSWPVSGIERIRYSGCFITLKIEGKNRDQQNRLVSWGFRYWEDPV